MIRHSADTLLAGSVWQGQLKINKLHHPEAVNFYIIDGSAEFIKRDIYGAAELNENCA